MKIGVIGAGPVGIYLTKLCLDVGLEVTLIESGSISYESSNLNRSKYIFKTRSAMPEGVHKIGGGGNLWRGRISEFLPGDFNKWFGETDYSWPFTKNSLEHHYKNLYKFVGAGDFDDNEAISKYLHSSLKNLPKNFYFRSFRYCKSNFFSDLFADINRHTNLKVLSDHYCESICRDKLSNLLSVNLIKSDSQTTTIQFDKIVITAGTLQSTALLLRSHEVTPKSSYPALGRYLTEHIEGYIGYVTVKSKCEKKFFKSFALNNFNITNYDYQGIGFAISPKNNGQEQLNIQYEFRPLIKPSYYFERIIKKQSNKCLQKYLSSLILMEKICLSTLVKLQSIIRSLQRKTAYSIYIKSEEIPYYESQLDTLDSDPKIVIYNHKISERTYELIKNNIDEFSEIFSNNFRAKLRLTTSIANLKTMQNHFGPNWHPMGSTKMGNNSSNSVCDENLEVHNCKNLFILSASVFPSASNTNPTFTVLALANKLLNSATFWK